MREHENFYKAVIAGSIEEARKLAKKKKPNRPALESALLTVVTEMSGDKLVEAIHFLRGELNVNVHAKYGENEESALHVAARLKKLEVMVLLSFMGIRPEMEDKHGRTALYYLTAEEKGELSELAKSVSSRAAKTKPNPSAVRTVGQSKKLQGRNPMEFFGSGVNAQAAVSNVNNVQADCKIIEEFMRTAPEPLNREILGHVVRLECARLHKAFGEYMVSLATIDYTRDRYIEDALLNVSRAQNCMNQLRQLNENVDSCERAIDSFVLLIAESYVDSMFKQTLLECEVTLLRLLPEVLLRDKSRVHEVEVNMLAIVMLQIKRQPLLKEVVQKLNDVKTLAAMRAIVDEYCHLNPIFSERLAFELIFERFEKASRTTKIQQAQLLTRQVSTEANHPVFVPPTAPGPVVLPDVPRPEAEKEEPVAVQRLQ